MKSIYGFTNLEIARLLRKVAAAYTILGENRFRVLAYESAATAIEHATSEAKDLWDDGKLEDIPGVGKNIADHLDELFRTGKVGHFEVVLKKMPPAMFNLLDLPGFGPKKAHKLVIELGINDPHNAINELKKAAKQHQIASLKNFGEKSEKDILEGIRLYELGQVKENRMSLVFADQLAEDLISYLKENAGEEILKIEKLGSLRRRVSTIGDVDLAIATRKPEEVLKIFTGYPRKKQIIERGPTGASLLISSGRQVDLRVCSPEDWGSMLQYFTGSKQHNIHLREWARQGGNSLSEYGIKSLKNGMIKQFSEEDIFYKYLGMEWIPPEIREDTGEIEAALGKKLPKLVELKEIRGDLQTHSNYNVEPSHDLGADTMESMLQVAKDLNYEYLAFSEHNPSVSNHSEEQIINILTARLAYIEHLRKSTNSIHILNLLEVDIDTKGILNLPKGAELLLDGCLASIHSNFNLGREEMTKRVIKGLSHPLVRIFAHPTGRLLGTREGYELDWETIFRFLLDNDKAIEINAYPNRLDLPDTLVREAIKRGVKLSLGTDAHNKEDLNLMRFGVSVARRGWSQASDIINTWDYDKILLWLKKRVRG